MSAIDLLTPEDVNDILLENSPDTRAVFRSLFRQSMYAVTKAVVCLRLDGPNLMANEVFKDRSDWLQWIVADHKRGLLEDPRSFIKSTGCTRTVPIWVAIQRVHGEYDAPAEIERATKYLAAHPHLKGVDNRIMLAGDSKKNAARFTGSTKTEFDSNPLLRWCFPELIWPDGKHNAIDDWTDEAFFLPGRSDPTLPNPFLEAVGIESSIVGGRADVIIYNDLVGDTNWRSASELARRREYVRTSSMLLADRNPDSPTGGVLIIEGNRWCLDDVNSIVHDEWERWAIWRRSAYKCYVHGLGNCGRRRSDDTDRDCAPTQESLWQERYPTVESLATLEAELGPEIWAAQYMNDPTIAAVLDANQFITCNIEIAAVTDANTGDFVRDWCATWRDEANKLHAVPLSTLTKHCISVDVASSVEKSACRTAVSWLALDRASGIHFWLDCKADRWSPEVAVRTAFEMGKDIAKMVGKWPKYLIEKVAAQTYFATSLEQMARAEKMRLEGGIEMVPVPRGVAKEDRNQRALGNLLGQRRLALRSGLQLPRTEIRHFPSGTMDALDTATQYITVVQGGIGGTNSAKLAQARQRARDRRLASAGPTGVSL